MFRTYPKVISKQSPQAHPTFQGRKHCKRTSYKITHDKDSSKTNESVNTMWMTRKEKSEMVVSLK